MPGGPGFTLIGDGPTVQREEEMRKTKGRLGRLAALLMVPAAISGVPARGQTFKVLYTFTGGTDGGVPFADLLRDEAGNLYGTTVFGGDHGTGTVFKIDTSGKETVMYSFGGIFGDGESPEGSLVLDTAGNFYSTTAFGGYAGTIFELDPAGRETVLHRFREGADGGLPYAGLVAGRAAGSFYGTTFEGGVYGAGTVFVVESRTGNEEVLHNFAGGINADGSQPSDALIWDSEGTLYGTTGYGGTGATNGGTVFKLDSTGKETVLYNFSGGADGANPRGGLVRDDLGNLYGTTAYGGVTGCDFGGCGTVFEVDPAGTETVLYSFRSGAEGAQDGATPEAGLVLDAEGNFYGTTSAGGGFDSGTVFRLDRTGKETVLFRFTGLSDGAFPFASVIRDAAGNLYGTTAYGGAYNAGVVFEITP